MTPEEIEACWRDRRNYKWGVYYCKADPRLIVPKRVKWMGWTINAARPASIPVVLLMIALMAGPAFIESLNGASQSTVLVTMAIGITLICLLSAWLSSTKRKGH